LIQIVARFLFNSGGEVSLNRGFITLRPGQPASDDVVGCLFAIVGGDPFEGLTGGIEFAKA
jgi:hypothetical protein